MPMPMPLETMETGLKRELVQHLVSQRTRAVEWQPQDMILETSRPSTKRSRTRDAIDESMVQPLCARFWWTRSAWSTW